MESRMPARRRLWTPGGLSLVVLVGCTQSSSELTHADGGATDAQALDAGADAGAGDASGGRDGATDGSLFDGGNANACATGFTRCNGVCVNQTNDNQNCGGCGTVCPSGELCNGGGACAVSCVSEETICSGVCTSVGTDNLNCGGCGHACPSGDVCNGSGVCAVSCVAGETNCNGACTNTSTDNANCGSCGAACAPGQVCNGQGTCAVTCAGGDTVCSGRCINLKTDNLNCGGCGSACPSGAVCNGEGACSCGCDVGQTNCATPSASCDCTNTTTDSLNCGACGASCPAGQVCDGKGSCEVYCPMGELNCGGLCIDIASDNKNCGACGNACLPGQACNGSGQCAASCSAGLTLCAGACTNTANDPANCGGCAGPDGGVACGSEEACFRGACASVAFTCAIDGGVVSAGDLNPANACESCQPTLNPTGWVVAATGVACNVSGTCLGGGCVMPPSCARGGAGMTDCGPDDGGVSCCTSLEITGGTYYRSFTSLDGGAVEDGSVADPAQVSGFRLDQYLVTVGRFRQFVNAILLPDGGLAWTPAAGAGKHAHLNGGQGVAAAGVDGGFEPGWAVTDNVNINLTELTSCGTPTWTLDAGAQENLPINCLTWQEAYAFCIWDNGFPATEAEYEYAMAAGAQQREYPWGGQDPGATDGYAIYEPASGYTFTGTTGSVVGIAPVGTATLGAGFWQQFDLTGDVSAWNLGWQDSPYINPCMDCASLTTGAYRVFRGGSFQDSASTLVSTNRSSAEPTIRLPYVGVRCARTP